MNRKQLISLWIGIIIIVLMGVFPPWIAETQLTYKEAVKFSKALGDDLIVDDPSYYPRYGESIKYRFILKPPWRILYSEPDPITGQTSDPYKISFFLLIIQWIIVAFITFGLIDHYKYRKKKKPKDD